MRVFIIDDNTEADLFIYGVDGGEHTEQFFIQHFSDKGVKFLTEEEKKKYNTSADYGIYNVCYEALAEIIEQLQATIDNIAEDMERSSCDPEKTYTFNDRCYVI